MAASTDLQRDLGATIAHVVGQAVVARAAGCDIHLAVDLHSDGGHFEGECWVRHPDGELPEHAKRPLGVAGCLASLAFLRGSPDELDAAELFDQLQAGEVHLSPADAQMAEGFTLADVAHALDTLRARWPVVADEVVRMSPQILNNIATTH
ncbi:MAG: hypothetical protein HZY77_01505 [Thiobacillus sp.]|uniref:hypothetical protein n=1 Tax=Thiobacillus sp. TaxID=924 RepID=UPI00168C96D5|nr:hypothetical protein [Thiobacillus sp.]QLQ01740.1 MAG: hypothetical protein HZY77_01505 [Thiobacillus sp.]